METLIATLVKDLEDGWMNRRQLFGSLSALVMTAPAGTGVINHVSWGISPWDTEGVRAELEKRGLSPRADMVGADFKSWHVLDPDGWDLQISNQTT